jgi:hypothetical protein
MFRILFACVLVSVIFGSSCSGKKKLAAMIKADTVAKAALQNDSLRKASAVYNNVNKQLALYDKNITFYGTNSIWDVLIQQDSILLFQSATDTLHFLISKKSQAQDAPIVRYYAKHQLGLSDTAHSKKQLVLTITEDLAFKFLCMIT